MIDTTHIPYRIEYYGPQGTIIRITTVSAMDHLDACGRGWDDMPDGANDFDVIELEETSA